MKTNSESEKKPALGKHHAALKVRTGLIEQRTYTPYGWFVMLLGGLFLLGGVLFSSLTFAGLAKAAKDDSFTPNFQALVIGSVFFLTGVFLLWGGFRLHRYLKKSKEDLERRLKEEYDVDEEMNI